MIWLLTLKKMKAEAKVSNFLKPLHFAEGLGLSQPLKHPPPVSDLKCLHLVVYREAQCSFGICDPHSG